MYIYECLKCFSQPRTQQQKNNNELQMNHHSLLSPFTSLPRVEQETKKIKNRKKSKKIQKKKKMFASTPATSRRNRRHTSSRRLKKSQQKSTRKSLDFLVTPSPSQGRRTSFEQSLVTKRPRRTRER